MESSRASVTSQALRTPRAAAAAGVAFALLLGTSIVILRLAIPATPAEVNFWLADAGRRNALIIALNLVPFAGIAFLWFIGVLRDRMGQREDRFFATVFLGSGLLFLAMLFISAALAGGLLATVYAAGSATTAQKEVWQFVRLVTFTIVTTYAMRMAAVFTISTATIGLRLAIMPRWIAWLGYGFAVILLLVVGTVRWVEILFPLWILLVSAHALVVGIPRSESEARAQASPAQTPEPVSKPPPRAPWNPEA